MENNLKFIKSNDSLNKECFDLSDGKWVGVDYLDYDFKFSKGKNKIRMPVDLKSLFYLTGIFICTGSIHRHYIETKFGLKRGEYLKIIENIKPWHFKKFDEYGTYYPQNDVIHLNVSNKKFYISKIKKALNLLDLEWWGKFDKNGDGTIYINSRELSEMFEYCGIERFNKKIPDWSKNVNTSLLFKLYEGLVDPIDNGNTKILYTPSFELAEDCIELGYKLGFLFSFKKINNNSYYINLKKIKNYVNRK